VDQYLSVLRGGVRSVFEAVAVVLAILLFSCALGAATAHAQETITLDNGEKAMVATNFICTGEGIELVAAAMVENASTNLAPLAKVGLCLGAQSASTHPILEVLTPVHTDSDGDQFVVVRVGDVVIDGAPSEAVWYTIAWVGRNTNIPSTSGLIQAFWGV
jgi:hypothetical protein